MASIAIIGLAAVSAGIGAYGLYNQVQGAAKTQQGIQTQQMAVQLQNKGSEIYYGQLQDTLKNYYGSENQALEGLYGAQTSVLQQQMGGYQLQQQGAAQQAQIGIEKAQNSAQYAGLEANINTQGAVLSAYGAQQSAGINTNIIGLQQQVETQRRSMMEIDARRQQLEIVRTQQRARSMALASATAQGAQKGSGLQGGYGQISGQTNTNLKGVQQNLEIGRNIFDINSGIANQQMDMQSLQTFLAMQNAGLTTQKSNLYSQYAQSQADFTTRSTQAGGLISQGQGQIYAAQGSLQAAQGAYSQAHGQAQQNQALSQGEAQKFYAYILGQSNLFSAQGGGAVTIGAGQSGFGNSLISSAPTFMGAGLQAINAGPSLGAATNNYLNPFTAFNNDGSFFSANPG